MHLQQTKVGSRRTGGPQYYFHAVLDHVKEFLRNRGACPVVLMTPYGIRESQFMAVGRDHKLQGRRVVAGRVGHDRIQQGRNRRSIGEEIRYWYGLRSDADFETVQIEVEIHPDGHFILIPTEVQMRGRARSTVLERIRSPLSFHKDYESKFWREEIDRRRKSSSDDVLWSLSQIRRVIDDHHDEDASHIHESDLLRTSGALSHLGLDLGAHRVTGYDCPNSYFRFSGLPTYDCPIELKKESKGFKYQTTNYPTIPRAVILCMQHNYINLPDHVDVIELPALVKYMES